MTNIMQKLADEGLEPFESAQEHYSAARNFVLTLVETTLPKNIQNIYPEKLTSLIFYIQITE